MSVHLGLKLNKLSKKKLRRCFGVDMHQLLYCEAKEIIKLKKPYFFNIATLKVVLFFSFVSLFISSLLYYDLFSEHGKRQNDLFNEFQQLNLIFLVL